MINELKYPVKYAIMQIEEQVGWSGGINELERDYEVIANIASKCYLISEKKEYKKDGSCEISYEVVFPYQKTGFYGEFERKNPNYSIYGKCINSMIVSELFDSFDEALKMAVEKNKKICIKLVRHKPHDKIETIVQQHQGNIDKYKMLENKIEENTTDMQVSMKSDSEDLLEITRTLTRNT